MIAGLRDALIGAGYTAEGLKGALGKAPSIDHATNSYYLVSQQLTL